MEDMFDSSNSEVFTGRFVVAMAGVEADVEEVEPVGAEAIEFDLGSDTMKNSLKNLEFQLQKYNNETTRK